DGDGRGVGAGARVDRARVVDVGGVAARDVDAGRRVGSGARLDVAGVHDAEVSGRRARVDAGGDGIGADRRGGDRPVVADVDIARHGRIRGDAGRAGVQRVAGEHRDVAGVGHARSALRLRLDADGVVVAGGRDRGAVSDIGIAAG